MAILIGDIPSMLLAAQERMTFLDFFWRDGKPGIFWFVQFGAFAGFAVIWPFIKKYRQKPERIEVARIRSWIPFWLIVVMVVMLALSAQWDRDMSKGYGGIICMLVALAGVIWYGFSVRKGAERHKWHLDWRTIVFLAAIFILVFMLVEAGAVETVVGRLSGLEGRNTFVVLTIIVWFSVMVSAIIDNIPYIAVMLPLVGNLADTLDINRMLLVLGLLIGSCMGGNITPIGAAANVAATGILEKERNPVSFWGFVRIGLPFTLAATSAAYLALYFVYR